MLCQHTVGSQLDITGVALHSGATCGVRLEPAPPDTGVVFQRRGGGHRVRAHVDNVVDSRFATTLGDGHWRVATVEHLLAALLAEGIDNVTVLVDGDELPVLDGSAAPWVALLRQAGRQALDAPRRVLVMTAPVEVRDGARFARLAPSVGLEVAARIVFDHPSIGEQHLDISLDNGTFSEQIAWARTFGFLEEVEAMRSAGLARGGSLDNAVVFGPDGALNPGGPRTADEPIRHKLLDMVGDLALIGLPVRARYEADLPGHALSRELVSTVLGRRDCWEVVVG